MGKKQHEPFQVVFNGSLQVAFQEIASSPTPAMECRD